MNLTASSQSKNSLCACGSGKKFKRCCWRPEPTVREKPEVQTPTHDLPGLIFLTPMRGGQLSWPTASCLIRDSKLPDVGIIHLAAENMPVAQARNFLAKKALEVPKRVNANMRPGFFCLWADSDAFWPAGTIERMLHTLRANPRIDILAGFFCKRVPFSAPLAYRGEKTIELGADFSMGDLVEVDHAGGHFFMHRLELLERLPEHPFTPLPDIPPEDLSFYARAREASCRIYVDTRSVVAHLDADTGLAYVPGAPAQRVTDFGTLEAAPIGAEREYGLSFSGTQVSRFSRLFGDEHDAYRS